MLKIKEMHLFQSYVKAKISEEFMKVRLKKDFSGSKRIKFSKMNEMLFCFKSFWGSEI